MVTWVLVNLRQIDHIIRMLTISVITLRSLHCISIRHNFKTKSLEPTYLYCYMICHLRYLCAEVISKNKSLRLKANKINCCLNVKICSAFCLFTKSLLLLFLSVFCFFVSSCFFLFFVVGGWMFQTAETTF